MGKAFPVEMWMAAIVGVGALALAAGHESVRGSRAPRVQPQIIALRAALHASRAPVGSADRTSVKRRAPDPLKAVAEAFLAVDPREVSDTELVAVLLAGSTDGDPIEAAGSLLANLGGNLARVGRAEGFLDRSDLRPMARARMLAAAELARRATMKGSTEGLGGKPISSPRDAEALARAYAGGPQERVVGLYFDPRMQLIASRTLHIGGTDLSIVDPREVLRPALEVRAKSIILVHNHPSGRAEASREDDIVTQRIAQGCAILGLQLLDHLVLGRAGQTYSYAESNDHLLRA